METSLNQTPMVGQAAGSLRRFAVPLMFLVIAALLSLLLGEQLLSGWVALGERANIARQDWNLFEIIIALGSVLWGIFCLYAALNITQQGGIQSLESYFEGKARPFLGTLALIGLAVVGVFGLLSAEQIGTGWLALGTRLNLSRRDINWIEWVAILASLLWGAATLFTAFRLWRRDRRAWAWARWLILLNALLGLVLFLSGVFEINPLIPAGGSASDILPDVVWLLVPALIVFFTCIALYQGLSVGIYTTPAQAIRNALSKSPSAGAIIGFLVIGIVLALASDLFLEPRSIASILATAITRGIVAVGITFLMISGEFDLSVGSTYGVGALVYLLMMTEGLPLAVLIGFPMVVAGVGFLISGLRSGRSINVGAGVVMLLIAIILPFIAPQQIITSVIPAVLIALLFTGLLGAVNGLILIWTGIPSFIVTLGTLLAYRAILLVVVADGRILRYADYLLPPPFVYFNRWVLAGLAVLVAVGIGLIVLSTVRVYWRSLQLRIEKRKNKQDSNDFSDLFLGLNALNLIVTLVVGVGAVIGLLAVALNQFTQNATLLEVSFFDLSNGKFDFVSVDVNLRSGVLWWLLIVVIFQFILTQTKYGNQVFAVGGNPGAARAQGIDVNRVKVINFAICAMLACVAGIINVARIANVDPLMGDGLELEVIAASVIGGALLSGGYGSIVGALVGVLIFGMIQTGLVLVNIDSRSFSGVIGIIIIIAVVLNTIVRRART